MKSSKNKAIMSKKSNGVGRPKILLDVKKIAELSKLQCTLEEIAAVMGVHRATLMRNYAQIIDDNREVGKSSLRRAMWKKALNKDNTKPKVKAKIRNELARRGIKIVWKTKTDE